MPSDPELRFESYRQVSERIRTLSVQPYERLGNWTLGQCCAHLAYYYRGSLEGFGFRLPWLVRATLGRWALKDILRRGGMKRNGPTIRASRPADQVDEQAAVEDALLLLDRLEAESEPLAPSPLFGPLDRNQWRQLHLIHSAHHLRLLRPVAREAPETG